MIRQIKAELYRMVCTPVFFLASLMIVVLFLSSGFYLLDGKELSVIRVIIDFSREELAKNELLTAYQAMLAAAGGWFTLLLPLVTAVVIVPVFRIERTSGFLRYEIIRTGKCRYYIAKCISSFLVGGLIIALGFMVYTIVVFICLPHREEFFITASEKRSFLFYILGLIFYGCVWGMLSIGIMGIVRNQYLGICIPFMFKYIYDQSYRKYYEFLGENSVFQSDGLLRISTENPNSGGIICYHMILTGVAVFCFVAGMQGRKDAGE